MRTTRLRTRVVSVPFVEASPWRFGNLLGISSIVVELETDEGIVGLGETPGVPSVALVGAALAEIEPFLLDQDPLRVGHLARVARSVAADHYPHVANPALAAVEMALVDIAGKALGCPAYQLLGGLECERHAFYWHVNDPNCSVAGARSAAAEGLGRGFSTMYLKVVSDVSTDLTIAEAVRDEIGGAVPLRLDPNEGWTALDVRLSLDRLDALHLEFLEQPFEADDTAAAIELRARSRTPVAANQSALRVEDAFELIARGAADVIVTGLHQLGGMLALRDVGAICHASRIPLVRHSLCDLGIATSAALHVLAAGPATALAHQTHLTLAEHDLIEDSWAFDDGTLSVRHGPGLGVELDEAAVAHYEDLHRRNGEFRSFGRTPASRA